ncbi:OB-fold domain-containing protein [Nocardia sp. NPDC050378]|uniref:Zn-ribbon domain-containing OB-fold protein n=1 Tax=Nocardia sp. NPDC050378 TaxID=3155400 RepID=UPI0033CA318D
MKHNGKAARPQATPETEFYWNKINKHELWLPRCTTTGKFFFYPKTHSPYVLGGAIEWARVSGEATLYSYNIVHRPVPGFEDRTPYAIAIVQLKEGPRMMTNIIGIENTPEALQLDMALQVDFEKRDDVTVPVFRPVMAA